MFNEVTDESVVSTFSETASPLAYNGSYSYDDNGNLETSTTTSGQLNRSTTYTYDPRNNMVTALDSRSGISTYSYDANDNITGISGPGGAMSFTYDGRDLVESATMGQYTFNFTYDINGNIRTATDPFGHVTTYGYDGYDRLSKVEDPLNNVTLIGRARFGNLLSLKKMDSAQTLLHRSIRVNDPLGRLTSYSVKMPDGDDIDYTISYDDDQRIVTVTDPLGRESKVYKQSDGKVWKEEDALGNTTQYDYDNRGNVIRVTQLEQSADGSVSNTYETVYTYNAHNKVESIKDPQDFITYFYYDESGNLTGSQDAEGNKVSHEFDTQNRKTKTVRHFNDGRKVETRFEYYGPNTYNPHDNSGAFSPANRLKAIIDDSGSRTSYEYDDQNRIIKITYPDESYIEYTYSQVEAFNDGAGTINYYRTVTEKQRNGTVVTHYYDQLQRLMKREITPAQGVEGTTEENYTYDGMSRVLTAANDSGTVEFDYDAAGRLKWEKQSGKLIEYSYDKINNLRSIKYPNARIIERDFDNLNRMNLIKEGGVTLAQMTHIGRSYRLLNKQYGNGDVISYLYDQGRRLTHKETKNKNDVLINKYVYGYNKVHMRTFEQRGHDENKGDLYAYDELYRLTHVKFNSPEPDNPLTTQFEKQKTYNLDKLDNIISIIENQNDRTTEIQTTIPEGSNYQKLNQYEYFDTWGLAYDLNGNTTQKGGQLFTYDYRNQVVQARDDNKTVDFKYDAMGRRIEKTVTTTSATNSTRFYYAGNQVIEERDSSDQVSKQFIFGNGIDEVLRVDLFSGGTSTPYYFHTNGNGSIVLITDADGNVIERITYNTYGMPTITDATGNVIATSTIGNEYLFHGRRYDREINLYYYRARYYDPIMGRFLQTDPMGYADSMNLYQGFNMNGVNFVDPMGLVSESGLGFRTKDDIESSFENRYSTINDPNNQQILFLWEMSDFGDSTVPYDVISGTEALHEGQPLSKLERILMATGTIAPFVSGKSLVKGYRKTSRALHKFKKYTKFFKKWIGSKQFRSTWKRVKEALGSIDEAKRVEGEIAKRFKDKLTRFGEDIYDGGKRLGEIDVELDDAIIEITIKPKAGKKFKQTTETLRNKTINPSGKKIILYAPNLYRKNLIDDLRKAGVDVATSLEELDKLVR